MPPFSPPRCRLPCTRHSEVYVSTNKRNVRTQIFVLAILAVGSILSACFPGTSVIGPHKAFAETTAPVAGALGIGDRTIAPLTEPVTTAAKVPAAQPAAVDAVSASSVKRVVAASPKRKVVRRVAHPKPKAIGRGSAGAWKPAKCSWYGPGLYGSGLAGGGRLGRNDMIVAHKKLPFGTKIQFTLKGRTVVAVVKDRGPYIRGRIFDLGPGTAKALRFDGVGVVKYRIVKMGRARHRR